MSLSRPLSIKIYICGFYIAMKRHGNILALDAIVLSFREKSYYFQDDHTHLFSKPIQVRNNGCLTIGAETYILLKQVKNQRLFGPVRENFATPQTLLPAGDGSRLGTFRCQKNKTNGSPRYPKTWLVAWSTTNAFAFLARDLKAYGGFCLKRSKTPFGNPSNATSKLAWLQLAI